MSHATLGVISATKFVSTWDLGVVLFWLVMSNSPNSATHFMSQLETSGLWRMERSGKIVVTMIKWHWKHFLSLRAAITKASVSFSIIE